MDAREIILTTNMRKNFKKNRKKGFSFLEVMLVVFILGTALTVFIQVIAKSMGHSIASRDTIIASQLAQEGAELVKNVRDNNWAQKTEGFLGANDINNGSYAVNYNENALVSLGTGKLKLDNVNGYYNTSSGSDTKFSRKIEVAGDASIKTITSLVVWDGSDFPNVDSCNITSKCVYAQITLTKWGE